MIARRRAQLRVCPVCAGVKARRLDVAGRVVPGAFEVAVCRACEHVGRDLIRALGLPPDAPTSGDTSGSSSSEITGEVQV